MEAREKAHRDYISFVHDAKVAAKAEGKTEGMSEGKAEDARKMKELGVDSDIIHQVTGISRDDIERL